MSFQILFATDDWFAAAECLLQPSPPVWKEGFTEQGCHRQQHRSPWPRSLNDTEKMQANGWTGGKVVGREFPVTTFALSSSACLELWDVIFFCNNHHLQNQIEIPSHGPELLQLLHRKSKKVQLIKARLRCTELSWTPASSLGTLRQELLSRFWNLCWRWRDYIYEKNI